MTDLQKQFQEEKGVSFDGIPINGVHLEYITWLEVQIQALRIHDVIERFSGENLMKLQKHFVSLYGSDEMAKEKANSFAVGFGKACELMIKELNAL